MISLFSRLNIHKPQTSKIIKPLIPTHETPDNAPSHLLWALKFPSPQALRSLRHAHFSQSLLSQIYSAFFFFCSTLSSSALLICGSTPPKAIVARISVSSSSSPRMASCRWRGVIRLTFRSLAAFPASSRTSAVRYSRTAVT